MMKPLNLPAFEMTIRVRNDQKQEVFDPVRKRFVTLTSEESVRQHMLNYLVHHRNFPASLIGVEVSLTYYKLKKRSDIVAFNRDGIPLLLVECKAPQVEITQEVFDQVAMYNMSFTGSYLVVTNGLTHYACKIDHDKRKWEFLPEIPEFSEICN